MEPLAHEGVTGLQVTVYVDNRKVAIMIETALAWIFIKTTAIVVMLGVVLYLARKCFGGLA